MRFFKIVTYVFVLILVFVILTAITQVGGVIFALSFIAHRYIDKKLKTRTGQFITKTLLFVFLYLIIVLWIVPPIAKHFGRVPLPITEHHNVQPAMRVTALTNRNYVRPELLKIVYEAGDNMNRQYPGTKLNYLDANFPFINGFRLLPHLSHHDGKKLDLSFLYRDSKSNQITDGIPSPIGYGICEEPKPGEENMPQVCAQRGFIQYGFLLKVVSQNRKPEFIVDEIRTRALIETIAAETEIAKIYIEPHLKTRWNVKTSKIKFHGCQAVRHDDHMHIQIK
jgi:hypothetical protein